MLSLDTSSVQTWTGRKVENANLPVDIRFTCFCLQTPPDHCLVFYNNWLFQKSAFGYGRKKDLLFSFL